MADDKNILETKLYYILLEMESKETPGKTILSSSIQRTNSNISDILERICEYMPEYTLHNITHCFNVLERISQILPECVNLNLAEIYILIQAVIFHDLGMAPSRDDLDDMKAEKEYDDFLNNNEWLTEGEAITEYIRRNHVRNSTLYMDRYKDLIVDLKNVNVISWIKNVILSHGMSMYDMEMNKDLFPIDLLIGDYTVNIAYLSILLRLGDILDFDNSRTPTVLFAHITPHNNVSLLEWKKHLSVTGKSITSTNIRFDMNSSDIVIERKIRDFIKSIDEEIVASKTYVESWRSERYKLLLSSRIDLRVYQNGYIYNDFEIEADYFGLSKILMGQQLYKEKDVFIRELLQNSIDACRVRKIDSELHKEQFKPEITISYNSETQIFSIEDNGCGIDEGILVNYILKIGKSYYYSRRKDFEKKGQSTINKFGIGLLSNFMVSDTITIESKRYTFKTLSTPLWVELNVNSTYVYQKQSYRDNYGTKITLHLNDNVAKTINNKSDNFIDIVKKYYFGEEYIINLIIDDSTYTLTNLLEEEFKRREQYIFDNKIELNDLPGVKGAIYYKKLLPDLFVTSDNIISYKGFKLSDNSVAAFALFNSCNIVINIDDPIQLDLNASRERFIINEKWHKFNTAIFGYIVSKAKSLNFPISDYLYINGHSGLEYMEEDQKIILWETINIEYWYESSWCRINFVSLIKEVMKRNVNILTVKYDNVSSNNFLSEFLTDSKNEFLIIKETNRIDLGVLLRPFISSFHYSILNKYELIPLEYSLKLIDNIESCLYNKSEITEKNIVFDDGKKDSIYLFLQLEESFFINAIININHPLAKLLKENKRNPILKIYTDTIRNNIINGFTNNILVDEFKPEEESLMSEIWNKSNNFCKKGFISENYINSANKFFDENVLPTITVELGIDYHLSKSSFPFWYMFT